MRTFVARIIILTGLGAVALGPVSVFSAERGTRAMRSEVGVLDTLAGSEARLDLEGACRRDGFRDLCLRKLLQYKCAAYAISAFDGFRGIACERAAIRLVRLLDLAGPVRRETDPYSTEVVFRSRLVEMVRDPATTLYLEKLLAGVERARDEGARFSLWDESLAHSEGDRDRALARIAVLFQDASPPTGAEGSSAYIRFLREQAFAEDPSVAERIDLLERIGRYFSPTALAHIPSVKVYPAGLDGDLNPGFYHFYVVLLLAERLREAGTSPEMAFFVPFLFNTQYEFKQMAGWPFRDPNGREAATHWKAREIYAGYLAARIGAGRKDRGFTLAEVTQALRASPFALLRRAFVAPFETTR